MTDRDIEDLHKRYQVASVEAWNQQSCLKDLHQHHSLEDQSCLFTSGRNSRHLTEPQLVLNVVAL